MIFKHSLPVEHPQSYPRVIIVWKLASACLQDLSAPPSPLPPHSPPQISSLEPPPPPLLSHPYLPALYCLSRSTISSNLPPPRQTHPRPSPALGGLMEIRLYSPGPPTSAFGGDMRGAGGRTYRFICGTVRGTGRPFKRYLFQLCTVDIKAGAAAAAAELFGKRSQCRLRSLARLPRSVNLLSRGDSIFGDGRAESERLGNMSHFENVPSRPSARSL